MKKLTKTFLKAIASTPLALGVSMALVAMAEAQTSGTGTIQATVVCTAPSLREDGTAYQPDASTKFTVYEKLGTDPTKDQKLVDFIGKCGGDFTIIMGKHSLYMKTTDSMGLESTIPSKTVDFNTYPPSAPTGLAVTKVLVIFGGAK